MAGRKSTFTGSHMSSSLCSSCPHTPLRAYPAVFATAAQTAFSAATAGTSASALVENLDCVLGPAEPIPSVEETSEKFHATEVGSARRRSHLEAWQRVDVARHDEKLTDDKSLLLRLVLVGLLFLFSPQAHLLENKGLAFLML